jgi:uncharacterized protein (TIGR02996 family)
VDERDFLQAILADPDDDSPRLIFADWLEEHGDPERAEFIRTQIELDSIPYLDVRQFCARLRLESIIEKNIERWNSDLPEWARKVCETARHQSYRRGMPSVIHCEARDWLNQGNELIDKYPIDQVKFGWYGLQSILDKWLESPLTRRVKRFDLSGQYLTDDDLKVIAASPALSQVEVLELAQNSFGDAGAIALAESLYLGNLQELDLYVTGVGPSGFRAITHSTRMPSLRRLIIGQNYSKVGDTEMADLMDSPHQYEQLVLSGTTITDQGVEHLCKSPCVARIKHLDLGGNAITGRAATAIAKTAAFSQLATLVLGNTQIGTDGAKELASSLFLNQLRQLNLLRAEIGPEGVIALGQSPILRNLIDLDLRFNSVGDNGLVSLANSQNAPSLVDLKIKKCGVTSDGIAAVAASPMVHQLVRLDASENAIDDVGAKAIAASNHLNNLQLLVLFRNEIGDEGAAAIAKGKGLGKLRILQLGQNRVGDSGTLAFLNPTSIPNQCNLVFHGNPISDAAWAKLDAARGDFFVLHYADDLLGIPQRAGNGNETKKTLAESLGIESGN